MAFQNFWLNYKLGEPLREKQKLTKGTAVNSRVIIEYSGPKAERIMSRVEKNYGSLYRELGLIRALAVELPVTALREIAGLMGVIKIWEDTTVYAMVNQTVSDIGGSRVQDIGYTGKGIVIALLDTGIFPHEDLIVPENRILAWRDLLQERLEPYDDHGHGTHVAGIIAGNGHASDGRYRGMAPESRLVGIKVLDREGTGRLSDVIAGLEWCLTHQAALNIRVINLSLGTRAQGNYKVDPLCRATAMAVHRGIAVCASGKNESLPEDLSNSPGINPSIITVGNYDGQKTFAGEDIRGLQYSGPGYSKARPDLVAPGRSIISLKDDGDYAALSGTSPATALVSGAVAQILQKWPNLRPERVKWLLRKNARNLGVGMNLQGSGMLDLDAIFHTKPNQTPKAELARLQPSLSGEFFKMLANIIGSIFDSSGPNGELLPNLLMSLLNGIK